MTNDTLPPIDPPAPAHPNCLLCQKPMNPHPIFPWHYECRNHQFVVRCVPVQISVSVHNYFFIHRFQEDYDVTYCPSDGVLTISNQKPMTIVSKLIIPNLNKDKLNKIFQLKAFL